MNDSTFSFAERQQKQNPGSNSVADSQQSHSETPPPPAHPLSQLRTAGDSRLAATVFEHFADLPQISHQEQRGKQPLPSGVMAQMERGFGCSFSDVTIKPNSAMAKEHGAQAVARGTELHFGPGQYNPDSHSGRQLIGHELAHVVQQRGGKVQGGAGSVNSDAGLEAEAEAQGIQVAAGQTLRPAQLSSSAPAPASAPLQCRKPGDDPLAQNGAKNQAQGSSGSGSDAAGSKDGEPTAESPTRTHWKEQLGSLFGGPLYDLIVKNLEAEDLESYFKSGVDSVLKAALDRAKATKPVQDAIHAKDAPTLPGKSPEQLFDAMSDSLKSLINKAAMDWAKTPAAQRLFASIASVVKENPTAVAITMPLLLMGAAGIAYVSNWNLPAIKAPISLGKSDVSVTPMVDLGSLQEITHLRSKAIEALGVEIAIHKTGLDFSVGVEHRNDKEGLFTKTLAGNTRINGNVTVRLDNGDTLNMNGLVSLDLQGKVATLKLASEYKHLIPGNLLNGGETMLVISPNFHKDFSDKPAIGGGLKISLSNKVFSFSTSVDVQHGPMINGGGLDYSVKVGLGIHF